MKQLSPKHIENCSREISRWAKAVRLISVLEHNLPKDFPEPDLIEPDRKPFDLKITWEADNPNHSAKLCKCIAKAFDEAGNKETWHREVTGHFGMRGCFRLGKKTTMYLRLLVADGRVGQSLAPYYN